jgi:hypothetical protein
LEEALNLSSDRILNDDELRSALRARFSILIGWLGALTSKFDVPTAGRIAGHREQSRKEARND